MVERGDINFTMSHIPPKVLCDVFFKCSITNLMVYEPHRNNNTKEYLHDVKAVSQMKMYHFTLIK